MPPLAPAGERVVVLAETRFVLARALREAGADRARAMRLARQARDVYRSLGSRPAALARVEAWLARNADR